MGCLVSTEEGVFDLLDRAYGICLQEPEKLNVNRTFGDKREMMVLSKLLHYSIEELSELCEHYCAVSNSSDGRVDSREVLWDFLVRPPYMNDPEMNPVIAAAICERVSEDENLNFAVCAQLLSTLQRGSCEEQLTFLFTILDTDNSGWILHSDLSLLVDMYDSSLAANFTDQNNCDAGESRRQRVVLQLLAVLDVNDSGRIEFISVLDNSRFVSKALGIEDYRNPEGTSTTGVRVETWKTLQDGVIGQRIRKSLITSKLKRKSGISTVVSESSDGETTTPSPGIPGIQNSSFDLPESPLGIPCTDSRELAPSTCGSPLAGHAHARQMSFFQFKRQPGSYYEEKESNIDCLSRSSDSSMFRSPFQMSPSFQIDKAPRPRAGFKQDVREASSPSFFDEVSIADSSFCLNDPVISGTQRIRKRVSISQSILGASSLCSISPQMRPVDRSDANPRFDLDTIIGISDVKKNSQHPIRTSTGPLSFGRVQSAATLDRHSSIQSTPSTSNSLVRQESLPAGGNPKRRMSTTLGRKKKRRGDIPVNVTKLGQLKRLGNSISQEIDGRPTSVDELLGLVHHRTVGISPPDSLLSSPTTVPDSPLMLPGSHRTVSTVVTAAVALIASVQYYAAPQTPVPIPVPPLDGTPDLLYSPRSLVRSRTSEEIMLELASLSPKSRPDSDSKIVLPGISEVVTEHSGSMSGSMNQESPWSVAMERSEQPLLPPTPGWTAGKQPATS